MLILFVNCLLFTWEAKSSTKVEDEASPWIYLYAFIVGLYINPSFNCHMCLFQYNFVTKLHWLCRSWIFIVFCPMDKFHLLIYFIYPLSFVINHIHIGYFELNWICFVFCQMDGCFDYFNRHNRTCIGHKDVWTSVILEHASFLIDRYMYKLIVYLIWWGGF